MVHPSGVFSVSVTGLTLDLAGTVTRLSQAVLKSLSALPELFTLGYKMIWQKLVRPFSVLASRNATVPLASIRCQPVGGANVAMSNFSDCASPFIAEKSITTGNIFFCIKINYQSLLVIFST